MTDENPQKDPPATPESDLISSLRDEMQAQIAELKKAFSEESEKKDALINQLSKDKEDLRAALIRSATAEPPKAPEPPKSEEEIYKEQIEGLAKKTFDYMRSYT